MCHESTEREQRYSTGTAQVQQRYSTGTALLSPTLGATDSLLLMSEEEFFLPRIHSIVTYTYAFA